MAAKKKALAAGAAAKAAKDSAYVQRLMHDDDLQHNLKKAYESARDAYSRLNNGKAPHKSLMDDRKLQKDIKQAAESIREATVALREAPNASKGGGMFRKLMLLTVAGGLAMALSESLRKKVLDALFGAEEEFEYTSTTAGGDSAGASTTTSSSSTTSAGGNGGSTAAAGSTS